jgi:peptidoglycan glycosyltransferase
VGDRPRITRRKSRRRRLLTRAAPIGGVAVIALAVGIVVGLDSQTSNRPLVTHFMADWERGQYGHMYPLLDASSQAQMSLSQMTSEYQAAATTATLTKLVAVKVGRQHGDEIDVRVRVHTKLFGTLHEIVRVPITGSGSDARIHFTSALLFPGLQPGEQLSRRMTLPARGTLFASDGTPLAQGPDRSSPIPTVANEIVGTLGPIPSVDAQMYAADGYPAGSKVGLDGLEHIFQTKLAGKPGGKLLAGARVLASAKSKPGQSVKTTINPTLEQDAINALAGRYAGIVAMDPRSGALEALAGVAFSAVQPPGSTMKIITASAALSAGIVKLSTIFPIAGSATIDGYQLNNAGGEECGGTLLNAFAVSCNSVFAPLGAKLGGTRLVAMAQKFGFNQQPSIPGATESTLPPADKIGDELAVGSSAIGQGMVQASALEMTDVAATIAMGGRRPVPTLLEHAPSHFVHVISAHVAHQVQQMMVAVVEFGTGTSAQIPGVTIAGKTGTAELIDTSNPNNPNASSPTNTDSWFVGYGPVGSPRIVVGALFPNAGAGAQTAAPAVRDVLASVLEH